MHLYIANDCNLLLLLRHCQYNMLMQTGAACRLPVAVVESPVCK